MPSVVELSASYANIMLRPRPGPGVCSRCFDLIDGQARCQQCERHSGWVDVMDPISYCVGGEQLHHALAGYKRYTGPPARYFSVGLAAVLWRHLHDHEGCLARAAGTDRFELVTTVPSSVPGREETHPLHRLVADLVTPVRERYERLLRRTDRAVTAHCFNLDRYETIAEVGGRSVLLIDDTWTTGANAQSAAAALKAAGAQRVAATVIGRYVNREWSRNDRQLHGLAHPFDWTRCAHCDATGRDG